MDNIAKKLKFKNKKETIIKHISSNLILKDNVIEVIENVDGYPIWGVQFHPERMFEDNYPIASSIFDFFIKKASTYRHAKELHRKIISIDTHTDSPLDFKGAYSIGNRGHVKFPLLQDRPNPQTHPRPS